MDRSKWEYKKLKDVCVSIDDGDWIESQDQSSEGIRLIQTGNIGIGEFLDKSDKAKYISEDTFERLKCKEIFCGDCLISRLPDPIGRACILPDMSDRMITAVDCSIVRFKDIIVPDFFVHYTKSRNYNSDINKHATGATRKRISRKNLEGVMIPAPPVADQQRIVAELDCLNEMIALKQEQLKEFDKLARSIFHDMFGDKDFPKYQLKDVLSKIGSGATPSGGNQSYKTEGISLIRSLNVHNNEFVYKDLAFIDEQQAKQLNNVTIEENDVLLNITGASVARCCIVPSDVLPARVNQHVSILRPRNELLDCLYLCHYLISCEEQTKLLSLSKSKAATREALPKNLLEKYMIKLPPLALQQQFAEKIQAIEAQKELVKKSIAETQHLLDSRMDYYFD